jgi:hypothetical protein
MNNVYIYDSSQIHVYETEDLGSITDVATSTVNHGEKFFDSIVNVGVDFIVPVGQDFIVNEVTGSIDYENVWVTETLYPVSGNINFSGGEENAATVVFVAIAETIILRVSAIVVTKQAWAGSGTLFEIGSGLERMLAPYIGGSGGVPSLKTYGAAHDSATSSYNEDAIITYGSDADYGVVAATVGSSNDYGQVTGIVTEGETDNGTVVDVGGSNPFGLFSITGFNSNLGKIKSYSGSGSFSVLSGGVDQLEEPSGAQTYVVGRDLATGQFIRRDVIGLTFSGGNPEAFARVGYQGSGVLFGFNNGNEAKVYDYTTESAVTLEPLVENGSVASSHSTSDDYGQIAGVVTEGDADNGSVLITQTTPTFGLFKFSGGGHGAARSRDFVGSGSLSITKHIDSYGEGQSSQIAFIPHYRSRGGIVVTNHIIPDAFAKTHVGSGSLFHIGEKTERRIFSYNAEGPAPVYETIGSSDAGIVDQSAGINEDYGILTQTFTNGILDYGQLKPGFFKFGNLKITGGDRAHANPRAYLGESEINISGAATVQFSEPAVQIYVYGHRPQEASQGEFIKIIGGMSSIITSKGTYFTSGSLFSSGTVDESAVFDYNDSSIATVQTPIDNGLITASGSTSDYGQISEPGYGETDLGQVIATQTTQPFGKLFELAGGDIAHANPVAYTGSIARVRITGGYSNLKFTSGAGESTVLFSTSSKGENSFSRPYIASGSLFSIGDRIERTAYSYNISSIVEVEDPTDYGSVANNATQTIDNGDFFSYALEEDRGSMWSLPGDENPLGKLFEIKGTAIEQFFPIFAWDKLSAPIRIFNDQQDPADFRFMPHWRGVPVGSPKLSNAPDGEFNTYAQARPFIGGGRLFSIGDKFESATFNYNSSSVVTFVIDDDYGSIANNSTTNINYGQIVDIVTEGEEDLGQVIITETIQPLTGLYQLSGEGDTQFFRGPYVVRPTTIRIFNEQQDPADFTFTPHWRSRPYEQGKLSGNAETPRARDFVGKGRLFGLGDKVESATFRYTTGSIVVVETPEDYGLINSNSTQNLDHGTIGSDLTPGGEVDFGQIIITETTQSATGLYKFTGNTRTQFFRGPYSGKGEISFYKGQSAATDFTFTPHWRGVPDEQFKVSGIAETPRARDFVGSGSLFHIGEKIEKAVFSYNSSSVEVFESPEEYGYITSSASTIDDYGLLTTTSGGDFDYGEIFITQTTKPYGLFRFRGGGHGAIKISTPPTNTFKLTISGTAIEKFGSQGGESTILFKTSGGEINALAKVYVGEGSLFHIGEKIEKAVFSYNSSSIVLGTTYEDFATVASTPTTTENYGSVVDAYLPPNTDHGDIVILPGNENPFGRLFEITGGDSGHKQTFAEFSSGSLFTAIGTSECVGFNPPEETFLFGFSGAAVEKHVENWVGSGNIKIKEETPLAPNAAVRFRPHWRTQHLLGTPRILGNTEVAFKGAYVSKGVFPRIYTHNQGNEWRSYRPSPRYVNSIYGKIGGSAFVYGDGDTRKINVYQYYGDLAEPGTSGSLFTFNSATEVAGYNPSTETVLFSAYGTSPSKWLPSWTSRPDGSPRLSGTPELQLRFNIFTNPEGESIAIGGDAIPVRTIVYNGSGSLFTAGSSAEVVGFNPFTDTRAFTFSGEPIVKINLRIFGGGQIFGFGGGAESTTIDAPESTVLFVSSGSANTDRSRAYEGIGTEFISGQSENIRTRAFAGEGSLFSAESAAEVTAISKPESTVLFKASGGEANAFVRSAIAEGNITISDNLDEAFARPYIGEGSLFGFNGAAEAVTIDEESIGLFTFQGFAGVLRDRSFSGSGSLFSVGNAAEVASVAPETTGLFRISGDSDDSRTRIFAGTGSTFLSGINEESFTKGNYDGEGSFSTFGGGAEVVGFNPGEETFLYEFNGNATSTRTRGFAGSGTANVHNDTVVPIITLSFVGEGTLSTFGGAAESRTIDVENTTLFEFRNGATESFTKGNYDTEGSATISGEATDIKLTRANSGFAYVSATGDSHDTRSRAYEGSGSLFGLNGATIARAIDYDETSIGAQGEVVSTNLFTLIGNNPGSVTRITQATTAELITAGDAKTRLFLFSPPRKFGTII